MKNTFTGTLMGYKILLLFLTIFSTISLPVQAQDDKKSLVCYYDSTSYWREGEGKFMAENIDPNLCTHIIYSYIGLSERTNGLYTRDPGLDLNEGEIEPDPEPGSNNKGDKNMIRKTVQLRDDLEGGNRDLKVLISVGGKDEKSRTFSNMARHIGNRTKFVSSACDFLEKFNLDGIDLDWQFPSQGDGRPEDKQDLVSVFKEMRVGLDSLSIKTGRTYILTGAFGCKRDVIEIGYDLEELTKYVDRFHLTSFDLKVFSGETAEGTLIGHHSPLYPKTSELEKDQELNAEFCVNSYLQSGVPPQKLLLGVSTYARTYEVNGVSNFYETAEGLGIPGPLTLESGLLSYYEICMELKDNMNTWQIRYDYDYQIPYGFSTTTWIGYDNEISAQEKVDFAVQNNLGGMAVKFLDLDDWKNICEGWFPYAITGTIKDRLSYHEFITTDRS